MSARSSFQMNRPRLCQNMHQRDVTPIPWHWSCRPGLAPAEDLRTSYWTGTFLPAPVASMKRSGQLVPPMVLGRLFLHAAGIEPVACLLAWWLCLHKPPVTLVPKQKASTHREISHQSQTTRKPGIFSDHPRNAPFCEPRWKKKSAHDIDQ